MRTRMQRFFEISHDMVKIRNTSKAVISVLLCKSGLFMSGNMACV